jgi:hypothetical protein
LKEFSQATAGGFQRSLGVMTALAILAALTAAAIGLRFLLWMPPIRD